MRTELEKIWSALQACELPREFPDLFASIHSEDSGIFDLQETYIVDFKDKTPKNFTDDYGVSIIRLALAFHNTYGGIIVFGVDDKTRLPSGLSVNLDVEAFNSCVKQCTGSKFEAISRLYSIPNAEVDKKICVLLIPRRLSVPPVRLTRKIGKYDPGALWIRERHEALRVRPEHFPILYSTRETYPSERQAASASIQRSMPPKPATIKQFVGRENILADLWEWLIYGDQPRVYLHGPGGSGKSAIAFEFADSITTSDSEIRFSGGERIDYVLFLSGKETELDTSAGKIRVFSDRQFSSATEIWRAILVESAYSSADEVDGLEEEDLEDRIAEMFDTYSGVIVLDDIDALGRRGVDTGEEALFMRALCGTQRTRVIYTLRQSPSHARKSSIHVPGLSDHELSEFSEVACDQFRVPQLNPDEFQLIKVETNALPLLVENILGLRKYCSSYQAAIRQHAERGGDDARRYLYQREYDHLDRKGRSREVLAALALIREPVRFTILSDILDFSNQVVVDALNECSNIFLVMEEDEKGETAYQISPVARTFVEGASRSLKYYEQISRKVKLFGREEASAEENSVIVRFERLLRAQKFQDVVELSEAIDPADVARANPKIRALSGRAYANAGLGQRAKAVECFRFAESMGYFDIEMMRSWYFIETQAGSEIDRIEDLCEKVIRRPHVAGKYRAEFWGKLGWARLQEARALRFVAREKALPFYSSALIAFSKGMYLAQVNDVIGNKRSHYDLANTCAEFIASSRGNLDAFFKSIEALAEEKHDISVDAAEIFVRSLISSRHLPFSPDGQRKFLGHLRRCRNKLGRAVKAIAEGPGGLYLMDSFKRFEQTLQEQLP